MSAYYQLAVRLQKTLQILTESAMKIGQMQMIKKCVSWQLKICAQSSAQLLRNVVVALNK